MRRGELYLLRQQGTRDPRRQRVFAIVSRASLIASSHSTVICAPVYSVHDGLASQVLVGIDEGLKSASSIHCDELMSIPKAMLTNYVGALSSQKLEQLDHALAVALALDRE